ncbi:PREDICTED: chemokine XC receptor 1 [Nanorana parkeri]|uniref:chemokine XC receptor 1 n=1 Tax=Nanorana parkeri TaxID=125878 RepID=UPI00085491BC|nr:PREDICTED: chemokine XC receptor 1 [Nanorana parkeri]
MMEETTFPDYTTDYDPVIVSPCNKEDVKMFVTLFSTILNSFIFIFGIIGNCLVLWILMTYESLESLTNIFIFNLSIADLILTSCLPFFSVYQSQGWVFGAMACKIFNILFSIGFYSGLIFLTFLTYHRYLAVVDPLSALKAKKTFLGILITVLAWVISIVASVPVMIFQVHSTTGDHNKCEYDQVFPVLLSHYQQNISFLLAFSSIIFCYYRIISTLQHSRSQRNHKPVRLILFIVLVYFLSWTPYNVTILLQSFHHQQFLMDCELIKRIDYAKYVSEKIALSHCFLNPILYAFVGIKFRRHLKHLIKRYCPCKHEEVHGTRITSHDQYLNGIDSVY